MIAVDTSSMIAYLAGHAGADTDAADQAIAHKSAILPPVVLTELLSAPNMDADIRQTLVSLPTLDVMDGYWERAGLLRGLLMARGLKARLADALIAQSCLDHDVPLITRDHDFRHFTRHAALRLITEGR